MMFKNHTAKFIASTPLCHMLSLHCQSWIRRRRARQRRSERNVKIKEVERHNNVCWEINAKHDVSTKSERARGQAKKKASLVSNKTESTWYIQARAKLVRFPTSTRSRTYNCSCLFCSFHFTFVLFVNVISRFAHFSGDTFFSILHHFHFILSTRARKKGSERKKKKWIYFYK